MLRAVNLNKTFYSGIFRRKGISALDNVSFHINKGETLGLIGESGSGKTTAGKLVAGLLEPTGGRVYVNGRDIFRLRSGELKEFRRKVQMIFQEPEEALDPRWTIAKSMAEPFLLHRLAPETGVNESVLELLNIVGLHPEHLNRFPFELSGGQLQRISLARALALQPELLVADEPTSSLDVSVQAQVLNLLKELQSRYKLTILFITHDLHVAGRMCDRLAVMYRGNMVEEGPVTAVFKQAAHPYTRMLLNALLVPDPDRRRIRPSKIDSPPDDHDAEGAPSGNGCSFWGRCPVRERLCLERKPDLLPIMKTHHVACHRAAQPGSTRQAAAI